MKKKKQNTKLFRIESVIKKKVDNLFFKLKYYFNSFDS